jgi:glycosyltransferase involved in cell wall biosynthesis
MRVHTDALRVLIVTSIHPDFDARIWKHARSLVQAGYQVRLISPWRVTDREVRDGVELRPFHRVRRRLLRPILIPLRLGRQLLPAIRDADIVHFHDIDILPWMALLSMFRIVVYDVHENYPDEMLAREWIPRLLRKPLYHIVSAAEAILARMVRNCVLVVPAQDARFPPGRLRVVHIRNYATLDLLKTVRNDYLSRKDTVVFTGAHQRSNGSLLLLDIATRSVARGLDLQFVMTDRFDDESFRRRFLAEIDRLGLSTRIVIRPFVAAHDIMSILNEGTVAISPNLRTPTQEKAIHVKLFEYMAAGLPIVASDLPNQLEFVGSANAGLLAKPEEPDTFVEALGHLVSNRAYAHQLGRNGQRAFVEKYSWESQMPALMTFYKTILPRGEAPGDTV